MCIARENGHDSFGHIIVESIVRREDCNIMFSDSIFEFKKRLTHFPKSYGLGLFRKSNGTSIIIRKNNNRTSTSFRIKNSLTGTIKRIAIHESNHGWILLWREETTPQMKLLSSSSTPIRILYGRSRPLLFRIKSSRAILNSLLMTAITRSLCLGRRERSIMR